MTSSDAVRPDIVQSIQGLLEKTSPGEGIHWTVFTKQFVEGGVCLNDELVSAMNSILLPNGNVSGMNHSYWVGPPT